MAGAVVECPSCQTQMEVPAPVEAVTEETAPVEAGDAVAAEAAPAADDAAADGPKCPSCGGVMEAGTVLCVQCGFHTKLGKKLSTNLS